MQVIEPSSIIKPPVDFTYEDVGVTSDVGSLDESPITFRHISTESGQSRRCEVKILEHGDGYEVLNHHFDLFLIVHLAVFEKSARSRFDFKF